MSLEEKKFVKAKNLHLSGKYKDAQKIYLDLIEKNKNNYLLQNLVGTTYLQLNDYDRAISHLENSIKLKPDFADNYNNIGIALSEKKKFEKAISCYEKAIALKQNYFDAYLNKGIALKNLKKFNNAIKSLEICIQINPNNAQTYLNLGNIFVILKKYEEAKNFFDKAIKLNKNYCEAYSNRAELLHLHLKNIDLAIIDYERALKCNDKLKYVLGKLIHAKMHINNWKDYDEQIKKLKKGIENGEKIILPFPLLSLIDEPKLQLITSKQYSDEISFFSKTSIQNKTINNKKIKIGYFSARFYDCATLHNMLDVFKNHNKEKFEIYAFNYGIEDSWTKKIKKYFNNFHNVSNLTLEEILKITKENQLNIAVNLTGHTSNARDEIFYKKVAPIQINFLGYPGTLGDKIYDYILADGTVIPEDQERFYSEKILRLPNCYLPTQSNQIISKKRYDKKNLKIPENKFIFACFNNSYKITPDIFKCWMKILVKNQQSILWLLKSNDQNENNLAEEAKREGVNPNRIFFANRVSVEEHIKRMELIDLFLDTFPYNAHTTAREAIKMNVPVLTIKGKTFASRVASSILKTVGLENLIVENLDDYIDKAIKLSNNKNEIKKIKEHLKKDHNINKLFDSKKYTEDLEKAYESVLR